MAQQFTSSMSKSGKGGGNSGKQKGNKGAGSETRSAMTKQNEANKGPKRSRVDSGHRKEYDPDSMIKGKRKGPGIYKPPVKSNPNPNKVIQGGGGYQPTKEGGSTPGMPHQKGAVVKNGWSIGGNPTSGSEGQVPQVWVGNKTNTLQADGNEGSGIMSKDYIRQLKDPGWGGRGQK
jgi:hypothetical protein